MNILIFTSQFYQPGGAEKLQVELAVELSKRDDLNVRLLHQGYEDDPRLTASVKKYRKQGLAVDALGIGYNPSLWKFKRSVKRLRDYIKAHQIDIVETGLFLPTILAAHATRNMKVKLFEGIHAPFTPDVSLGRFSVLRRWMWCSSVRKNVAFYAISNYVADCWASYASVPRETIEVIHNSAGTEFFEVQPKREEFAQNLGLNLDRLWVLFAGRIRQDKGVLTLLKAISRLEGEPIELLIAGRVEPGNEYIAEAIERSNQHGPLAGHIHFLGYREDLPELMASSDLFVLPTQREGFGMVLIESLATGTPVVTTSVDAIPEIMEGSGASLVQPDNDLELATEIRKNLLMNDLERQLLIDQGLHHARQFTSANRTRALLGLFSANQDK